MSLLDDQIAQIMQGQALGYTPEQLPAWAAFTNAGSLVPGRGPGGGRDGGVPFPPALGPPTGSQGYGPCTEEGQESRIFTSDSTSVSVVCRNGQWVASQDATPTGGRGPRPPGAPAPSPVPPLSSGGLGPCAASDEGKQTTYVKGDGTAVQATCKNGQWMADTPGTPTPAPAPSPVPPSPSPRHGGKVYRIPGQPDCVDEQGFTVTCTDDAILGWPPGFGPGVPGQPPGYSAPKPPTVPPVPPHPPIGGIPGRVPGVPGTPTGGVVPFPPTLGPPTGPFQPPPIFGEPGTPIGSPGGGGGGNTPSYIPGLAPGASGFAPPQFPLWVYTGVGDTSDPDKAKIVPFGGAPSDGWKQISSLPQNAAPTPGLTPGAPGPGVPAPAPYPGYPNVPGGVPSGPPPAGSLGTCQIKEEGVVVAYTKPDGTKGCKVCTGQFWYDTEGTECLGGTPGTPPGPGTPSVPGTPPPPSTPTGGGEDFGTCTSEGATKLFVRTNGSSITVVCQGGKWVAFTGGSQPPNIPSPPKGSGFDGTAAPTGGSFYGGAGSTSPGGLTPNLDEMMQQILQNNSQPWGGGQ